MVRISVRFNTNVALAPSHDMKCKIRCLLDAPSQYEILVNLWEQDAIESGLKGPQKMVDSPQRLDKLRSSYLYLSQDKTLLC